MARHLTERDIKEAEEILWSWPKDLTWQKFCRVHGEAVGHQFSRMALYKEKSGRVLKAFQEAKDRIRGKKVGPDEQTLEERKIKKLEAKIEVLQRENANLLDRFRCWQHNARVRGVTFEELDRPLAPMPKR